MAQDTGATLRSLYLPAGGVRRAFTTKAADYSASRPDYPPGLFRALRRACPPDRGARVVDIGAGTGLLTRGLLQQGYRVVAVEPNTAMRRVADRALGGLPGYRSVAGAAESIPLPARSVGMVTAAQAFHWFEIEEARAEFLRLLTLNGQVALIWNDRVADDPVHVALDKVFANFGGAKRGALLAHENRDDVPRFFGANRPRTLTWPHAHRLDAAGLASLVFSRSYMPGRRSRAGAEIALQVGRIFRRLAVGGMIEVPYRTIAIIGRPAGPRPRRRSPRKSV